MCLAPLPPGCGGYHYWWLTLTHELGHILSLEDDQSPTCVMRDGLAMLHPCANEVNWVNDHYEW